MQRLQRLSGLDASFLYLETSTQPLHVCSVLELDANSVFQVGLARFVISAFVCHNRCVR